MTGRHSNKSDWRNSAEQFDALAAEYDSWFVDNPLFTIELAALRALETQCSRPFLEIGVGPGRFAQELKVEYGIDPALSALQLAYHRSILGIRGIGEELPIRSGSVGTVFILFTLCFLADPSLVLQECSRILRTNGHLVVGLIPRASAWGKALERKKKEGNLFYRNAKFRSVAETVEMAAFRGFSLTEACSTLFHPPGDKLAAEYPRRGYDEDAGFNVLVFARKEGCT